MHFRTSSMQRAIYSASIRDMFGRFKHKWGMHYTRSLLCAHKLQQVRIFADNCLVCTRAHTVCQCHNYKDPSVQLYGGAMFKVTHLLAFHFQCI